MRLLRLLTPIALFLAVVGCALFDGQTDAGTPGPDAAGDEVALAQDEPREPVLTVPEAYDAISLSVQAGDPEAAIAAYEEASLEDPDDPQTQVLLANLFLIAGEIDQAVALLDAVLVDEPENTDALYLVSLVRGLEGRPDAQRELLERILTIDPEDARARSSLAELLLQERSFAAAAANFEQAIESEPDNLVARVGLGNVYLRQDRFEDAEEQLSEAIEIAPDYPYAYSDRARARALQYDLAGAEQDLNEAIALDSNYYWHYIDRGRVRLEQRRFAQAEEDFSEAVALNSELFLAYSLRAQARDSQDKLTEALADYNEALRRRPDYYPAYTPVGVLSYLLEDYEGAAVFARAAFEEEPERFELALLAALAMKSGGNDAEAREFVEDIVNDAPRDSLAYDTLRYYLQPGNEGYVLAEIQASTDDVKKGQMYFYVGAQLELLGRVRTAQASYLQTEDLLQPGFVEYRLAQWRLRPYRSGEDSSGG
jgi:tetratricopeptide (TPR) repeat protein